MSKPLVDGTEIGYNYDGTCPEHGTEERKAYGNLSRVAVFSGCRCAVQIASDNFSTYYTSYSAAAGRKEIDRQKGY